MEKHETQEYAIKEKLALGAGFFVLFFLGQSVAVLAIPYYQMTLGVSPFYLSLLMAIPLLLASSLGPIVGHFSDNFKSSYGRRRPILFVAAILCCLSFGIIWMVPERWSSTEILVYFGITTFIFNIAYVLYSVSLNSLVYDISLSSHLRTKLLGFTSYFVKFGSLSYQWLFPLSQVVLVSGLVLGVRGVGWALAIIVFGFMGIVPALVLRESSGKPIFAKEKNNFLHNLIHVLKNKDMFLVICLTFLQMGGSAFAASMDYYLLVYYVHAGNLVSGSIAKGMLSTAYAMVSIFAIPFIVRLCSRVGKLKALTYIYIINAVGGVLKWFIFVPNADWLIVCDAILCGAVWSAMVIIIPSMISDLVHGDANVKSDNQLGSGIFASIHGWALSVSSVFALLASGVVLSAIHFNSALGAEQHSYTILWMRVILSGGTLLFSLASIMLILNRQARYSTNPWL